MTIKNRIQLLMMEVLFLKDTVLKCFTVGNFITVKHKMNELQELVLFSVVVTVFIICHQVP